MSPLQIGVVIVNKQFGLYVVKAQVGQLMLWKTMYIDGKIVEL